MDPKETELNDEEDEVAEKLRRGDMGAFGKVIWKRSEARPDCTKHDLHTLPSLIYVVQEREPVSMLRVRRSG